MERMTKRDRGGNARMDCDKCEIKYRENCCSTKLCRNALIDRLAAYEDAEEAGLLVRLPCKPREVVWVYYPKYKEIERIAYMTKSEILEDIEIFSAVICKTREEAEAVLKGEGADV